VAGIVAAELGLTLAVVYHKRLPVFTKILEHICNVHWYLQIRDPQLRAKLTPCYGFGCKRPSFSNEYRRAFRRDNVDLVTDSIAEITKDGVRTVDGTHREVDTLVLATGSRSSMSPIAFTASTESKSRTCGTGNARSRIKA
jgi:cation diffusion facilitator CzcD-associated flavoprotein CzcO